MQRSGRCLFWDTLRERGNDYLRHNQRATRQCSNSSTSC